jgi:hypothetical protein
MNTQTLEKQIDVNVVIEYRIKNVYGRENIYITSEHAKFVKILTKKETIDGTDMGALESLGFTFTRVF